MYRILVSDPLEQTGLAMLRESGHQVDELSAEDKPRIGEMIAQYDALVVRSGTQVTAELLSAGDNLRVVGRAGIGVDNVDTQAATELGILVVNAPTANQISATEHTLALMLALARNVAAADADLKGGEWNRKKFVGTELQGKTLGVIGYGRIGQQVARRARAFDMQIIAYDPFLDADRVRAADAEPVTLDELMARADVVTLHVPLTDDTRGLLDGNRLRKLKQGAMLVNCARGGVVDEVVLLELLESGQVAGAGLDVFAQEPPIDYALAQHPRVVATPHLGAQTREAQVRISTQTAKMVLAALDGSLAVTAVNLPFRSTGTAGEPYLRLAEKLGHLASGMVDGSIQRVGVEMCGIEESLAPSVTVAALKGVLGHFLGEAVNYVNAEVVARDRGIEVARSVCNDTGTYPNLVRVELSADDKIMRIEGTLFLDRESRVVRLAGYRLEFRPKGPLLVVRNRDVPGVVGKLGTMLGDAGLNIAEIHLAREASAELALAVVRLDEAPSAEVMTLVRTLDEVVDAELIDVGLP